MLKEKDAVIRKATIIFDGFLVSLAFLLAYFLRKHFHAFYKLDIIPSNEVISPNIEFIREYLILFVFAIFLWCFMFYLNGMYRSMRTRRLFEIIWIIIKSCFFASLGLGTIIFLLKLHVVSRVFFVIFTISTFAFILFEKIMLFSFMHYVRKKGRNYRQLLIVGTGKRAADFIEKIQNHQEWGLRIIGAINDDSSRQIERVSDISVIGTLKDLTKILHEQAVDEVIFVIPRSRLSHVESAINECETEGIKATIAVDLFNLKIARSNPTDLDGIPLVSFETTVAKEWELFIKRVIDIIISGTGIVLLSPIFLVVSVLIKLTSPGPVLYRQQRLGLNGRRFLLNKFRTMYQGAHQALSKVGDLNEMNGSDFKKKKIRWITPIGRLLRKFSIDELPQLFNVFLGHMSFVGPRPTVPDEVVLYSCWQRRRFSMKPGITCLWQIKGRNNIGHEEWMKMDLEYLDNWSLWLDFKILIKTIPVVIFGIGAY